MKPVKDFLLDIPFLRKPGSPVAPSTISLVRSVIVCGSDDSHYNLGERSPLAWVPGFARSMTGALGGDVRYELRKTVNPLVYKITFYFPDALTGQQMLLV